MVLFQAYFFFGRFDPTLDLDSLFSAVELAALDAALCCDAFPCEATLVFEALCSALDDPAAFVALPSCCEPTLVFDSL